MSIFSLIRKGRQQAKEASKKQGTKQGTEPAKVPYKHIPTHAAIDALAGAPASYKAEDRKRILEENKRRSAQMHSGVSRVSSSLSNVMYPDTHANPMVYTPRSYSYVASSYQGGSSEAILQATINGYSTPPFLGAPSVKGKEIERILGERRPRNGNRSRAPSSSGNSTYSQDGLEMKVVRRPRRDPLSPVVSDTSPPVPSKQSQQRRAPTRRSPSDQPTPPAPPVAVSAQVAATKAPSADSSSSPSDGPSPTVPPRRTGLRRIRQLFH